MKEKETVTIVKECTNLSSLSSRKHRAVRSKRPTRTSPRRVRAGSNADRRHARSARYETHRDGRSDDVCPGAGGARRRLAANLLCLLAGRQPGQCRSFVAPVRISPNSRNTPYSTASWT
uniref:(northern house mosquito) hypothetical protein n=1 Tax=Culex pipiens TaxID=7175 RepID=A0A8D8AJF0_CULPI